MRAIFERNKKINIGDQFVFSDDRAHHLNVVRTRVGDEIRIFDGHGCAYEAKVQAITKKEVSLEILSLEEKKQQQQLVLFIGVPKKDAFEDILKIAVEAGFTAIIPLTTSYSQFEYVESDRLNKIIESALVQSNNFFWPKIYSQLKLQDLNTLDLELDTTILFSSFAEGKNDEVNKQIWHRTGIFIGPEAGFSPAEEEQILASKFKTLRKHLPCPILRAPTAVAVSAGYIYSQMQK